MWILHYCHFYQIISSSLMVIMVVTVNKFSSVIVVLTLFFKSSRHPYSSYSLDPDDISSP